MLKSMTAYARASKITSVGRFDVEIQTVNRKFLDIIVELPPELARFESEIKKQVAGHAKRGRIKVRISAEYAELLPISFRPNLVLAKQVEFPAQFASGFCRSTAPSFVLEGGDRVPRESEVRY